MKVKVIDLAIGFSRGIIPAKIKYKGFIYEYLKDIKDYITLEDGHIKTLQINVEQFNDEVEIIKDKKKTIPDGKVYDLNKFAEDYPGAAELLKDVAMLVMNE